MITSQRLELASQARARVARAIALLESPTATALDESSSELAAAIGRIEQLKDAGASLPCPSRPVVIALRKDLRRVRVLLRHAWDLQMARGRQFGYTRTGEIVRDPSPSARWALEG